MKKTKRKRTAGDLSATMSWMRRCWRDLVPPRSSRTTGTPVNLSCQLETRPSAPPPAWSCTPVRRHTSGWLEKRFRPTRLLAARTYRLAIDEHTYTYRAEPCPQATEERVNRQPLNGDAMISRPQSCRFRVRPDLLGETGSTRPERWTYRTEVRNNLLRLGLSPVEEGNLHLSPIKATRTDHIDKGEGD